MIWIIVDQNRRCYFKRTALTSTYHLRVSQVEHVIYVSVVYRIISCHKIVILHTRGLYLYWGVRWFGSSVQILHLVNNFSDQELLNYITEECSVICHRLHNYSCDILESMLCLKPLILPL